MFAATKKVRVARIALFALLFSALSSTVATVWFQHRADILAEICSTSGIKKILSSIDRAGPHAPGKPGGGIYCAQCLASAAAPAIATPSLAAVFATVAGEVPAATPAPVLSSGNPALSPPPRGPPAVL